MKRMKPVIVAFGEEDMDASGDSFLHRFRSCLDCQWIHYHALDAALGGRNVRLLLPWEGTWIRLHTISIIACEGSERLVRPLSKAAWHAWFRSWGFKGLPLNQLVLDAVQHVMSTYSSDFSSSSDGTTLWLNFQGRPMTHATCWAPAGGGPPFNLQAPSAEPWESSPAAF